MATAILAVATAFLAWKTRSMANETKGVTEATFKVAEAALEQTQGSEAPVGANGATAHHLSRSAARKRTAVARCGTVVSVPSRSGPMAHRHGVTYIAGSHPAVQVMEKGDSVTGWFTVRNVGNGLAMLNMSESRIYPRNGNVAFEDVHPTVVSPVLPPGRSVDVEFTIPRSKSADQQKMTIFQLASGGVGDELFAIELAYSDSLGNAQTLARFRAHRNESKKQPWSIFEVEYRLSNGEIVRTRRFG